MTQATQHRRGARREESADPLARRRCRRRLDHPAQRFRREFRVRHDDRRRPLSIAVPPLTHATLPFLRPRSPSSPTPLSGRARVVRIARDDCDAFATLWIGSPVAETDRVTRPRPGAHPGTTGHAGAGHPVRRFQQRATCPDDVPAEGRGPTQHRAGDHRRHPRILRWPAGLRTGTDRAGGWQEAMKALGVGALTARAYWAGWLPLEF